MDTFVLLPLQQSIAQCSVGIHDQWRRYMTVLVMNGGMMESISIPSPVIRRMTTFHIDLPEHCFWQEVQCAPAICQQLSTLSALDLDCVHHLPHALPQQKVQVVCQKEIDQFQTLCVGFKAEEIIKFCYIVHC